MAINLCEKIQPGQQLTISLPLGMEFRSITNIADGPPSDCALVHSLMLQLTPTLASMACLLKVLKVISAISKAATATPTPIVSGIGDITSAIAEMSDCLDIVLGPLPICKMVKDILAMVISYLNCMIEAVESVLNFQLGINLDAAQGNPVLLDVLSCAQENAQASMDSMMGAMQGLEPLMQMINMVLGIVGEDPIETPPLAVETPSLSELAGGADPLEPVKAVVDALQAAHDILPC